MKRIFLFVLILLCLPVFTALSDPPLTAEADLPWDLSPAPAPDPAGFSEAAYADASIRATLETVEEDGVIWRVAHVEIASPTQLRTYTASPEKLLSQRTAPVSKMAAAAGAVVAINGDYYMNDPKEASVEYRMGRKIRHKAYREKDVLLIDDQGDFHLIRPKGRMTNAQQLAMLEEAFEKWHVMNAFTFGPALVIDGAVQEINPRYSYTPNRKDPRAAIGQTGRLCYVLVLAEGRGESSGATMVELADFMARLGCLQAYNLDGGNSAQLVFGTQAFKGQPDASDRGVNDIIYFGSAAQ